MKKNTLWHKLVSHPMSEWRNADSHYIPKINPNSRLIWCGIGGSLLSADALTKIFANRAKLDHWTTLISPELIHFKLNPYDRVILASKSGTTLELWTWISRLTASNNWQKLRYPPIVVTQNNNNPLMQWGIKNKYLICLIPNNIGGRYSAFTPIGTIPLAWMAMNTELFIKGGQSIIKEIELDYGIWNTRIWKMIDTLYKGYCSNIREWVLLTYSQQLEPIISWWIQLVSESLGKTTNNGIHRGITPIKSVGPLDQHTQLQRWLSGPKNIGLIILTVNKDSLKEESLNVPSLCPYPALKHLQGNVILNAQAESTIESLRAADVPTIHWILEQPNEYNIGQFMMSWQIIVSLTGFKLGINPFNQPNIEHTKEVALQKLKLI